MTRDMSITEPYLRWWEFPLQSLAPNPPNVRYTCDKVLGSPSRGNCEAALYNMIQSGNVKLDPTSSPRTIASGRFRLSSCVAVTNVFILANCAISIKAYQTHSIPWDMLRGVAENLVSKCATNSAASLLGGRAMGQPISQSSARRTLQLRHKQGIGKSRLAISARGRTQC